MDLTSLSPVAGFLVSASNVPPVDPADGCKPFVQSSDVSSGFGRWTNGPHSRAFGLG